MQQLIDLTARREGFGALLAHGSRRLGKHFNAEEEAVQVNGLEVAYHDPRGGFGHGIGVCHQSARGVS